MSRWLAPLAEVRRGEARTAALLSAFGFLVLCAYYVLKTVREPLILADGGAEVKSYAAAAQVLLLVPVVWGYDRVARRLGRFELLAALNVFFASHVLAFPLLSAAGVSVAVPFFLWVGVFSLIVVAQFWSFAADVYTPAQGKRLFAVLGVGCCLGAFAGSALSGVLLERLAPLSTAMVGGALLVCSLVPAMLVHRSEPQAEAAVRCAGHGPEGAVGGLALVLRDRYLRGIAVFTLVVSWVATLGEYALDRILLATAVRRGLDVGGFVGAFKSDLYAWTSVLALIVALFFVSRVFRYLGVRVALLVPVVLALGGYGLVAVLPLLSVVAVVKVAEGAIAVSLHNTVRQSLYLGTSRSARYRAKAVIDTLLWRAGDVLAAAVVFVGNAVGFGIRDFVLVTVALAAVWLAVVASVAREHRRRDLRGRPDLVPSAADAE